MLACLSVPAPSPASDVLSAGRVIALPGNARPPASPSPHRLCRKFHVSLWPGTATARGHLERVRPGPPEPRPEPLPAQEPPHLPSRLWGGGGGRHHTRPSLPFALPPVCPCSCSHITLRVLRGCGHCRGAPPRAGEGRGPGCWPHSRLFETRHWKWGKSQEGGPSGGAAGLR